MLKYDEFKDDEIHEIIPFFITNGFGAINEEDMGIEEEIEYEAEHVLHNSPSNTSNRQSSAELFSTTDEFVHTEYNNMNRIRRLPEHGTISWWNEFFNVIRNHHHLTGETLPEDAKLLFQISLDNGFTQKNIIKILRKLNIRFRQNQRKKSELISLLQIHYSFDVELE